MATEPSAFSLVYNGKKSIALHSPYLSATLIVIGNLHATCSLLSPGYRKKR